ncbi:hypothetical protein GCM10022222_09660 [Amycolatopsis ultiminotia]|uniref:Uncharacterized protein n=1 Tax=Amycolatopsis ultiminotia TaxID=543629 RepID=A0ABP6V4C9_9PSEU
MPAHHNPTSKQATTTHFEDTALGHKLRHRRDQAPTVRGRIWIGGEEIEVRDDEWFGFRDHSPGVRTDVGEPPPDGYRR